MANFREVFEADYCGHQLFTDSVLIPVFGDIQQAWNESFDNDLTDNDKKIIQSVYRFGNFSLTLGDEMLCFDVTLQPNIQLAKSKVQIQQFIRKLMLVNSAALIVFHYPDVINTEWRVSFVYKEKSAIDGTPAKRYTYLVGKNKHCRTAAERFSLLATKEKSIKNIIEAFNVESLTKDFYNELFSWYQWALTDNDGFAVRYPNDTGTETDDRKIDEHLIRLITRLMFVWFIKQKGLVPNDIFTINSLTKILKNFNPYSKEQGNYYNGILQNLFFATLNKAIDERAFANDSTNREDGKEHYGIKTLFRNPKGDSWFQIPNSEVVKLFSQVPFLNGGLFECLDKEKDNSKKILYFDGFSREEKVNGYLTRAFVPNCLFFDPQKGIIPLLERYNFTIEENTPTEVEVALDPELLGKVFENLLGAYNPETKETARKQSGSFYTPREIVSYIVDESLIALLCSKCPNIGEEQIRQLFKHEANAITIDDSSRKALIDQLKSAKILDPACGSGAFPMGVLHRIVDLLQKLNDEEAKTPYDQKLHLIQNCIYGVDIQTIAVQISKLRFFISLVCEQPRDAKAENFGITPLPNLETKFVAANTLIGLNKGFSDRLDLSYTHIRELKDKLWDIRRQHFSARNAKQKHELRKHDETLRSTIEKQIVNIATKPDPAKIESLQTEIKTLQAEKEKFAGERWVSIAPPEAKQMSMFHSPAPEQQTLKIDKNREERDRIDKLIKEKQKELLKETSKSNLEGFESEAAQLAKWNPYDQNTSSPFFDIEWMFDVKEGFDVVIGNPPYKILTKNNSIELTEYSKIFKSFKKSSSKNLYILFIEKALQLIQIKGTLSYIVPEGLFKTRSYTGCVELLEKAGQIQTIVTFTDYVFENAVTGSLIFVFNNNQKGETQHFHFDEKFELQSIEKQENSILELIKLNSKNLNEQAILFKGMVVKDRVTVISNDNKGKKNIFLLGKNITKWVVTSKFYTNYSDLEIVGGTKKLEKHSKFPRILIRRTGDILCCAYLNEEALTESTLYSCWSINPSLSNKCLIGLLNSKLLNYYNKELNITNQQGFPQILMTDLETLPIKIPDTKVEKLVDYILFLKTKMGQLTISEIVPVYFEQIIDGMVYELYFPELIKKHDREIIKHLGDLPDISKISDDTKIIKIIQDVFDRLNDKEHPVRVNLFYMDSIPEIAIIEGKNLN